MNRWNRIALDGFSFNIICVSRAILFGGCICVWRLRVSSSRLCGGVDVCWIQWFDDRYKKSNSMRKERSEMRSTERTKRDGNSCNGGHMRCRKAHAWAKSWTIVKYAPILSFSLIVFLSMNFVFSPGLVENRTVVLCIILAGRAQVTGWIYLDSSLSSLTFFKQFRIAIKLD